MNSPTEQHLGAAFRDLVAEQPFIPDAAAIAHRARQDRRRHRIVRAGIGAGVVAATVAVGVASTVPSAPARTAEAAGAHASKAQPSKARPSVSPAGSTGTKPALMTLAANVAAESRPAGDATLVERETTLAGQATITVWDLYTDDGRYFFSQSRAGLPAQVQEDNNQGDGMFGREIAAAVYAVSGNLDTAALKMAWAADTTPVPGWLSAQVKDIAAGGLQIDNYVWENSQDALIAGSGNPQVRAGVLRLLSILPGISVTRGTAGGQPTLTLTAGAPELGRSGINKADPKIPTGVPYQEALTINADTGVPLKFVGGPANQADTTVAYVVTRVNLADIAAGKF